MAHGSMGLAERLAAELREQGKKPYIVPVGGSNSLGCWGYMMAMQEIISQTAEDGKFSHIVMVCMLTMRVLDRASLVPALYSGNAWQSEQNIRSHAGMWEWCNHWRTRIGESSDRLRCQGHRIRSV